MEIIARKFSRREKPVSTFSVFWISTRARARAESGFSSCDMLMSGCALSAAHSFSNDASKPNKNLPSICAASFFASTTTWRFCVIVHAHFTSFHCLCFCAVSNHTFSQPRKLLLAEDGSEERKKANGKKMKNERGKGPSPSQRLIGGALTLSPMMLFWSRPAPKATRKSRG